MRCTARCALTYKRCRGLTVNRSITGHIDSWTWNNRRLHSEIGDIPPAEKEALNYSNEEITECLHCVSRKPPSNPERFILTSLAGLRGHVVHGAQSGLRVDV